MQGMCHYPLGYTALFLSGEGILLMGNTRFGHELLPTFSLLFLARPFPKRLAQTQYGAQLMSVELRSSELRALIQQRPTAWPKPSPHTTESYSPPRPSVSLTDFPAGPSLSRCPHQAGHSFKRILHVHEVCAQS